MEQNLQRRVAGLKGKLPDIQKTLDTVRFLKLRTVSWGPSAPSGPSRNVLLTGADMGAGRVGSYRDDIRT